MRNEWIIAGFGGQGVLFLGDLIARAGMTQGYQVTYMPTYGVAMRGGTANCVVHLSDESIGSPLLDRPDAAIILNQQSFDKFQPAVKKGGLIVANSSLVDQDSFRREGEVRIVWTPATEIARVTAGTERAANMAALGAFMAAEGTLEATAVEAILGEEKDERKRALLQKNLDAFNAGIETVKVSA